MDSEGTNGEYIVMDCDVYIVMDSEAKLFMITEGVFLYVGDVHIEVLYGMELNDLLHCGTEGGYVNGRMEKRLEFAKMDRDVWISPCLVERLLETLVSTCSVSNTGVLLQVADGKSEGEPADGSSVDGGNGHGYLDLVS